MYEPFYNLSCRPFRLLPDPQFIFRNQEHKRALSYLLYGLEQGEGFVVITGDVGTGKTLLIHSLTRELEQREVTVAHVATANLDADGVLPMVTSAFGLAHDGASKAELLARLSQLQHCPRGALLVVDEAQTLTPAALEELRALSNIQTGGRALLQIFLVGQTELYATLGSPRMEQLRQRIIASHHLKPLDAEEVTDYIRHRLVSAGWRGDPKLAKKLCRRVHGWSLGVPRRINQIMDRLLVYGYLEEKHKLAYADVQTVIEEFEAELPDAVIPPVEAETNTPLDATDEGLLFRRMAALEERLERLEGPSGNPGAGDGRIPDPPGGAAAGLDGETEPAPGKSRGRLRVQSLTRRPPNED